MTALNSIHAYGIILAYNLTGATTPLVTLAEVANASFDGTAQNAIDVTTHDSANRTNELIKGMIDPGTLTLDLNYNPDLASHNSVTGVLADLGSVDIPYWELTFPVAMPSPPTWNFLAFVTSFPLAFDLTDKITSSVNLQITGAVTYV